MLEFVVLFLAVVFFSGAVAWVADKKGYSWGLWFVFGLLALPCAMFAIAFAPINRATGKDGPCKTCPWCREPVLKKAFVCPHCGRKQNKPASFSFSEGQHEGAQ